MFKKIYFALNNFTLRKVGIKAIAIETSISLPLFNHAVPSF